jgi:hypothetical protein
LNLSSKFNQGLEKVPSSLQSLAFGRSSNQSLEKVLCQAACRVSLWQFFQTELRKGCWRGHEYQLLPPTMLQSAPVILVRSGSTQQPAELEFRQRFQSELEKGCSAKQLAERGIWPFLQSKLGKGRSAESLQSMSFSSSLQQSFKKVAGTAMNTSCYHLQCCIQCL